VLVPAHLVLSGERAELEERTTTAEGEGQRIPRLGRGSVPPYQRIGHWLAPEIEHLRECRISA
jgi:hypothetical protein